MSWKTPVPNQWFLQKKGVSFLIMRDKDGYFCSYRKDLNLITTLFHEEREHTDPYKSCPLNFSYRTLKEAKDACIRKHRKMLQ